MGCLLCSASNDCRQRSFCFYTFIAFLSFVVIFFSDNFINRGSFSLTVKYFDDVMYDRHDDKDKYKDRNEKVEIVRCKNFTNTNDDHSN